MCVDLREANKAVITDSYPLPHIDELLSKLCGAIVFSTIDLESAYFNFFYIKKVVISLHSKHMKAYFGFPCTIWPSFGTFCIPENLICTARIDKCGPLSR